MQQQHDFCLSNRVFCNLKSVQFLASEILTGNVVFFSLVILIQASGSGQSQTLFLVPSRPNQWEVLLLIVVQSACLILLWTCLMLRFHFVEVSMKMERFLKVCERLKYKQ